MEELTAVEFRHKVRQQAKARTAKFRREQANRGYKNLTIYLSEDFRSELTRLSKEKGLSRQAAMEHIFSVYQQAINSNILHAEKIPQPVIEVENQEQTTEAESRGASRENSLDLMAKNRGVTPDQLIHQVPQNYQGDTVREFIKNALRFHDPVSIASAIDYTNLSGGITSAAMFAERAEDALRIGFYKIWIEPEELTSLKSETMSELMEKEETLNPVPDKVIESSIPEKIPLIEISDEEMMEAVKVFDEIAEEPHPADNNKIIENDLDLFTGESIPKPTLPDCHGKKLTVAERDKYLFRVEEMFPGKGKNQLRADALNKAGILTGRGKKWTEKLVADNLRLAKKRAEK